VPAKNLIGEEGKGFYQVLDGLNEERLVIAAECLGLGETALESGIAYANEREVFGGPIGANQAIQHPLAEAYADLLAAKKVIYDAADRLDDLDRTAAGAEANVAKYLAAEAAFEAADAAVQTHGGFGVAREYDVERYFREARLTRLVPVTQQLALNFLGERVLGYRGRTETNHVRVFRKKADDAIAIDPRSVCNRSGVRYRSRDRRTYRFRPDITPAAPRSVPSGFGRPTTTCRTYSAPTAAIAPIWTIWVGWTIPITPATKKATRSPYVCPRPKTKR